MLGDERIDAVYNSFDCSITVTYNTCGDHGTSTVTQYHVADDARNEKHFTEMNTKLVYQVNDLDLEIGGDQMPSRSESYDKYCFYLFISFLPHNV